MKYNFDKIIDRSATSSIKYSNAAFGNPEDAIPMWVADMDFKTAPEITAALAELTEHAIYGYTRTDSDYDLALCRWYRERFGFNVLPGWIIKSPAVLFSVGACVRALTEAGQAVIICQPVYHPFARIVEENGRKLIINRLHFNGVQYEIDFDAFEKQVKENKVKMFILCSPHNPVGRVWTREELKKLTEICIKYNVLILSDEIHSDLVFSGYKHTMTATLGEEVSDITITCTAPSKTFNLAGLQASQIFIKNPEIREIVAKEFARVECGMLNAAGITAAEAAYTSGGPWLEELIKYIEANAQYLEQELKAMGGQIKLVKPQATYIMWLDCRALKMDDAQLADFFLNKAKLWLNDGLSFGAGGSGFMRMNIACPRKTLERAMQNLRKALK